MPSTDPARSTLDHLLQGFQVIGRDWTYLYVNPAVAAQARTTVGALLGKKMWEAFPGFDQTPVFATLKKVMEERLPAAVENEFAYPDGQTRWFELRIEPVPDGLCVHSLDITERKAAEAELKRLNAELEARVQERTRELEAANRDLESYSYSVSHDLRAPLRAIDGFAAALEEDYGATLEPGAKAHLKRVRAAAGRMGQLIDDLLRLSRIGQARLLRADVDLSALAQEVAEALSEATPSRRVTWEIAPGLRAHCDRDLARVVLENLLGNAFKFTARTADARIVVRAAERGPPDGLSVEDNGAGFDMLSARVLFRPFRRLHSEDEFPGTGIGLATVHRIVEKHGGRIEAQGTPGQGARFTVWFGDRK